MKGSSYKMAENALEQEEINPRNNPVLMGHEEAEKFLLEAWKKNSLHNSWLISGVEGIGKATLAYRFARFLLSADENNKENYQSLNVGKDNQIFHLVAKDSHPDLKVLARDYTETDRKKVLKALKSGEALQDNELKELKKSAFIRVDDVRMINEFLSKRASNDGWRVVIVDSIDDLNTASANAILKILEEPPYKTIMLLISHNPNCLLPTIKSRCTKLYLQPLSETITASLLRRYRPEVSEKNIKGLAYLSAGSIGKAMSYADKDALDSYEKLSRIINSGKKFKLAELMAFVEAATIDEDSYYLAQELVLKYVAENIKQSSDIEAMAEIWEKALKVFNEVEVLNMDKKQTLMNVIYNICKIN